MSIKKVPDDYVKYVKEKSPKPSYVWKTICAFAIGGTICLLAQILMDLLISKGLTPEVAGKTLTVILIFTGALLTGLGWYDNITKYAGAGTLVPITGFANAIVSSAMEYKFEGFVSGLGGNMFKIAGPVIIFGTVAAVIVGIICFLF